MTYRMTGLLFNALAFPKATRVNNYVHHKTFQEKQKDVIKAIQPGNKKITNIVIIGGIGDA